MEWGGNGTVVFLCLVVLILILITLASAWLQDWMQGGAVSVDGVRVVQCHSSSSSMLPT